MTIEERDTARAVQTIAKALRKPHGADRETIRCRAAISAMQSLIRQTANTSPKFVAQRAVAYADALIEELKNPQDNDRQRP